MLCSAAHLLIRCRWSSALTTVPALFVKWLLFYWANLDSFLPIPNNAIRDWEDNITPAQGEFIKAWRFVSGDNRLICPSN